MEKKNVIKVISVVLGVFAVAGCVALGVTNIKSKADENEVIEFQVSSTSMDKAYARTEADAVYKTEYFSKSSTEYNHDLALLSLHMSRAACSTNESYARYGEEFSDVAYADYDNPDPYTARNAYLAKAYRNMGFTNDEYYKYEASLNDDSDTEAFGVATKKIIVDGKKYNLVSVAVRSASYGAGWASNYRVNNEEGLAGFESAAIDLYEKLKAYLKENGLNKSNTKVWLSGLSRGGAVANIAGAYLDRACQDKVLKLKRDNVYAYSFATPMGVKDEDAQDELYSNLKNIVINTDIVPYTMPTAWGYTRYGETYTIKVPHVSGKELKRISEGKKVDVDDETVELVKNVSRTYNECRYYYDKDYDMDTLHKGFAVKEDFTEAVEIAIGIFGNTSDEYAEKWQKGVTEMVPFVISQFKKYDRETGEWVAYDSLAEYMADYFDSSYVTNAVEAGVYSETEYNNLIEKIDKMKSKKLIDEESYDALVKIVDGYYGIRILAVNYNVNAELIKEVSERAIERLWGMAQRCLPVQDTLGFKYNHFASTYYAWMKNYDPSTGTVINN